MLNIFGPHVSRDAQLTMQREAYTAIARCVNAVEPYDRCAHDIASKIIQDKDRLKKVVSYTYS